MDIVVEVLECKSGVSKAGKPYNIALIRINGVVGKLFSDVALPVSASAQTVELVFGSNSELFLIPRIKSVR